MTQESAGEEKSSLLPWDPDRHLRKVDATEARLSRGFLRSKPERWFPSLAAQWLPLAHSLGVEVKLGEVKPIMRVPSSIELGYCASADAEPMALFFDRDVSSILDAVTPGAFPEAREVILEYLARRLLSSLALSWSGPESSVVQFEPTSQALSVPYVAAVKLGVLVNGEASTIWIALGRRLVERFDGLWRRQVHSTAKQGEGPLSARIEISQLAVPPAMLVDYTRSGTVIDLEIPMGDTAIIRGQGKSLYLGRLCNVGGVFGVETLPGPAASPALPEGTTRLSIELGGATLELSTVAELAQPGAILETQIPLSDRVQMVINGERVAEAHLCSYEGRFAVSVI